MDRLADGDDKETIIETYMTGERASNMAESSC